MKKNNQPTCKKCGLVVFNRKLDSGEWGALNADGSIHKDTCSGRNASVEVSRLITKQRKKDKKAAT